MSSIYKLLEKEEGWRSTPYLCSEGYPTVGYGFKIGPKGASLKNYTFTLPRGAGDSWLDAYLVEMMYSMAKSPRIISALLKTCPNLNDAYYNPRAAVLLSMCYQMGVNGVSGFKNTLALISEGKYEEAASNMLSSKWARQTPERAKRHSEQLRTGTWDESYN